MPEELIACNDCMWLNHEDLKKYAAKKKIDHALCHYAFNCLTGEVGWGEYGFRPSCAGLNDEGHCSYFTQKSTA